MNPALALVDRACGQGDDPDGAARTLGLLLERESARVSGADMLDEEWRDRRLEEPEVEAVVDRLIDYVRRTPVPLDGAIWALTKCYRPRIVPPLVDLLRRTMADPAHENLAYLALQGVVSSSSGSVHRDAALAAVEEAARHGHGRVAEGAAAYLRNRQ